MRCMSKDARKQINVRVDDETLEAIGVIQRLDTSQTTALNQTKAIKLAVLEKADRLRKAAEKRK